MHSPTRKLLFAAMFSLGVFCLGFETAESAFQRILNVRYSVSKDRTRVVIDCSSKFSYRVIPFHKPERIAVNLEGVKAPIAVRDRRITRGIVKGLRINRLTWGSQVVLDLRDFGNWKDFTLGRTRSKPHRIVLDVWKDKSVRKSYSQAPRPFIVAVDAGHGGSDPGAIGRYHLAEKDVALDLARRVAANLNKRPGFKAILTRKRDKFLTLKSRTELAREFGADAFVSIHLNSARKKTARGVEVFFISPAGAAAKASKLLADKKETAHELGMEVPESDDILYMILDVNQQAMMLRSSMLAEAILKSMRRKGLPPTRGMKQRSFAVLKTVTMPSVIVEAGFLSNLHDAKLLRSTKGRQNVADAIANGIARFFKLSPPRRTGKKLVVHEVKRGDSLWKIAKKYRVSMERLRRINKLGRTAKLQIGQKILIME